MTTSPTDDVSALAQVLHDSPGVRLCVGPRVNPGCTPCRDDARAILASSWLAQFKACIRVETLREAAEDVPLFEFMLVMDVAAEVAPAQIAGWLRARADDIERQAQP